MPATTTTVDFVITNRVKRNFVCTEHDWARGRESESDTVIVDAVVTSTPAGQEKGGVGRMFDQNRSTGGISQAVKTHQVRTTQKTFGYSNDG